MKKNKIEILIKIIIIIVAIVVVVMCFDGADSIEYAGGQMKVLRSVGGETVAEAYYQYYGSFLSGLSEVVRAIGITCGIMIVYVSKKFKIVQDN